MNKKVLLTEISGNIGLHCTKILFISFFTVTYCLNIFSQKSKDSHDHNHAGLHHWEIPSKDPDRIILTFN